MKPLTQLPYRTRPRDPEEPRAQRKPFLIAGDRELIPMGLILWLGALAQVVHAVARGKVFGGMSTLALVCVFGIPGLFWHSRTPREQR